MAILFLCHLQNLCIVLVKPETIRKNVICIGVPTIINLENVNPNNPDMLVSTKDIDLVIDGLSSIISMSINRIF